MKVSKLIAMIAGVCWISAFFCDKPEDIGRLAVSGLFFFALAVWLTVFRH